MPKNGSIAAVEQGSSDDDMPTGWCTGTMTEGSSSKAASPAACFIKNYMNAVNATENEFVDPSGYTYGLVIEDLAKGSTKSLAASDFDQYKVYIEKHAKCDGESAVYSANSRDYAVLYKLEGSGTYCADNGS